MHIAVVTDSTADLPPDLARSRDIQVIPAVLMIDGKSYADGQEFSREDFYRRLPELKALPTTGAPAVGAFERVYERLLATGYESVLSIHVAGKLSGVLNAAHAAAQNFSERVHVVDSQQVSMGLGYQALAAAEATAQGGGLDEVLEAAESVRRRLRLVAMLDSLEYLRRSGRVSWMQANLGSFLRIKLFLEVRDGEVLRRGQTRTRQKGMLQLVDQLEGLGSLARLAVLHTNAEQEGEELLELFRPDLPEAPLLINVTSVIGTHVGPGCLGYAALPRDDS